MAIADIGKTNKKGDETRDKIKAVGRELFSRYGIDLVTTRDIAKAANQKSVGSVNYYFRSKDDLILEILADAAWEHDKLQMQWLDRLEAEGAEIGLRDILKVLTLPDSPEAEEHIRLFAMLNIYRRDLMQTVFPKRWDKAYHRCLAYLETQLDYYDKKLLRQRMYFLIPYLWTLLATRHRPEHQNFQFWAHLWSNPVSIENLLDTAEGLLRQPPSEETLTAMARQGQEGGA